MESVDINKFPNLGKDLYGGVSYYCIQRSGFCLGSQMGWLEIYDGKLLVRGDAPKGCRECVFGTEVRGEN